MFSSRTTVIECGAAHAAVAMFRRSGGRLVLEKYVSQTISDAADRQEAWFEEIKGALATIGSKVTLRGRVLMVLPSHLAWSRFFPLPEVAPQKRERILRFEAEQHIPHALADVVWGNVATSAGATPGAVVFAVRKEIASRLAEAARSAGFDVALIVPASLANLAAWRAARRDASAGESELLVNCGPRSGVAVLAGPAGFLARNIPVGCSPAEFASGPSDFVSHLLHEISRTLRQFEDLGCASGPAGICLTGVAAKYPGLAERMAAELELPVRFLDLSGMVEFGSATALDIGPGCDFEIACVVGASAMDLFPGHVQLDLSPPSLKERRAMRMSRAWVIATGVNLLVVPLPALWHCAALIRESQMEANRLGSEIRPLAARADMNRDNFQRLEKAGREIARIGMLQEERGRWIRFFGELHECLERAGNAWIDRFQAIPGVDDRERRFEMSGRFLGVSENADADAAERFAWVKGLLMEISSLSQVVAIESERFSMGPAGEVRFDFILVTEEELFL